MLRFATRPVVSVATSTRRLWRNEPSRGRRSSTAAPRMPPCQTIQLITSRHRLTGRWARNGSKRPAEMNRSLPGGSAVAGVEKQISRPGHGPFGPPSVHLTVPQIRHKSRISPPTSGLDARGCFFRLGLLDRGRGSATITGALGLCRALRLAGNDLNEEGGWNGGFNNDRPCLYRRRSRKGKTMSQPCSGATIACVRLTRRFGRWLGQATKW